MVRIGIVGVGFMGMMHYLAAQRIQGAKVTALATRDPRKRAGDWTMIQGNFGPRGQKMDLSGVNTHARLDALLADPDLDLIDICLPIEQHRDATLAALQAGKNVLVEKAIALTSADADAMVQAAQTAGKQLMVAQVLPFFPDFGFALDCIRGGKFGKVLAARLRRHISPPNWSAAIADAKQSGGPIIDLHIHDTHFVRLAFGTPRFVQSRGRIDGQQVVYVDTQYDYGPDGPIISASSGAISQKSRPFTHGYEIYLEGATLFYEAGSAVNVFTPAGVEQPALGSADPVDAFAAELQHAIDALAQGVPAPYLAGELARDALVLCEKEAQSVRTGARVAVS